MTTKFTLLDSDQSGIRFNNVIDSKFTTILDYVNMYNGAGIGIGDFNKDGFEDIIFGGNVISSQLYLNNGETGSIGFTEVTKEAGIETQAWVNGVAVVDLNQDGWADIYFSVSNGKSAPERANLLYINQGPNKNGVPRFVEQGAQYGLNDTTHTIQAAFFDYDKDADLDVFMIVNYPTGYLNAEANRIVTLKPIGDPNHSDRLYRNDGMGPAGHPVFTNVSREAGITLEAFSLGLALSDFNEDGYPDVYVANDYVTNDIMYINNGDGTFSDQIREYVGHTSYSSMGMDIADINNDGLQDIMVLDMLPEADDKMKLMYSVTHHINNDFMKRSNYVDQYFRNTLQLNNGKNLNGQISYSEIGQLSGIFRTNWSWSTLLTDFDLDGWRDIFITNGFSKDVNDLDFINYQPSSPFEEKTFDGQAYIESLEMQKGIYVPNYIYQNQGDLTFSNQRKAWGLTQPSFSNGAAYADFDNDGDLDLVVSNINDPAFLYQNNTRSSESAGQNYLKITLEGESPNKQAIGAKIKFRTSTGVQSYEHFLIRGYMSSVSGVASFGLGKDTLVRKMNITWPDGTAQSLYDIKTNQNLVVKKQTGKLIESIPKEELNETGIFLKPKLEGVSYKHHENFYNDFNHQVLLPHKLSQNGPSVAVGDVDSNGTDDFYVGGANGSLGRFFYQKENGVFSSLTLEDKPQYEDQGSLIFDADTDGDLDLYIVSGGVEYGKESRYYEDRLLINNGHGDFTAAILALPKSNGSCVVAGDYDQDGDLDLFVGGRSLPNQYPLPAPSYILRNDSQYKDQPNFTDVTSQHLPELTNFGIVNSALWSDFDNDGWIDLFVAGEFLPITIFRNSKGKFQKIKDIGVPAKIGLWNSINGADLDMDGDIDYVLGNLGLNSRYQVTPTQPITIYTSDFDKNGTIDPIMTHFRGNREVAVHLRDDLFRQILSLKRKMPKYKQYAQAEISDIIPSKELSKAMKLTCDFLASACLMNLGNGKFEMQRLPQRAQFAPLYGTLIQDFTNNGHLDILAVGNSYASEAFSGKYDASIGCLLEGDGSGSFKNVPLNQSHFFVNGDAKALAQLRTYNDYFLTLVTVNNDSLEVFGTPGDTSKRVIPLQSDDVWAEISYEGGKKERREFYYGSGYLSQSTRSIAVRESIQSIKITNIQGEERQIDPNYSPPHGE